VTQKLLALHHGKDPAHASLFVRQMLASKNTTVIPHTRFSLDHATCEFFLFPKMKLRPNGDLSSALKKIQIE
jgi:hypothetical protein